MQNGSWGPSGRQHGLSHCHRSLLVGKGVQMGPSSLDCERVQGNAWGWRGGGRAGLARAGPQREQCLPVQGDPKGLKCWNPLGEHCWDAPRKGTLVDKHLLDQTGISQRPRPHPVHSSGQGRSRSSQSRHPAHALPFLSQGHRGLMCCLIPGGRCSCGGLGGGEQSGASSCPTPAPEAFLLDRRGTPGWTWSRACPLTHPGWLC